MYNIQRKKKELKEEMEMGCDTCGFAMKCDNGTNVEARKCFYSFVEHKVIDYLLKNKMNVDEWTCYGKMSLDSLIRLLIYLEVEGE